MSRTTNNDKNSESGNPTEKQNTNKDKEHNDKQMKQSFVDHRTKQKNAITGAYLEELMYNHNLPSKRDSTFEFHNVHLIDDGLYLGNGFAAEDLEFLRANGFTHVLNAAEGNSFLQVNTNADYYKVARIQYLGIPAVDEPGWKISVYFEEAARFIEDALSGGGKILVHCVAGVSRSATLVIAYLMISRGMSAPEACLHVYEKRFVMPNRGFLEQLAELNNTLNR